VVKRGIARLIGIILTVILAFFWASLIWPADAATEPATTPMITPAAIPAAGVPPVRIPLGRVTYYHAVPEQTDADPETSACGPTMPRQIAVSRDLFRTVLPCGTLVRLHVDGVGDLGVFTVWDTMATRWIATADVLYPNGTRPAWGRETGTLTLVGRH
jgi:hypothetical protein